MALAARRRIALDLVVCDSVPPRDCRWRYRGRRGYPPSRCHPITAVLRLASASDRRASRRRRKRTRPRRARPHARRLGSHRRARGRRRRGRLIHHVPGAATHGPTGCRTPAMHGTDRRPPLGTELLVPDSAEAEADPAFHDHALGRRRPHHRLSSPRSRRWSWWPVQRRLWNYASALGEMVTLMADLSASAGSDPVPLAGALVDWANAAGGHDNITAALARCDPSLRLQQGRTSGG